MLHIKLKEITYCGNMIPNIMPADHHSSPHDPRGWGQKVKIHLFHNMVKLHIKTKENMNAATL